MSGITSGFQPGDGGTDLEAGGRRSRPESINQGWSLTSVKASVPAPAFVMLTLAGVKLEVPAGPEKLKLAGLTVSATTAAGLTVKARVVLLLGSAWLVAVSVS
jgi:hypothetical protein